MREDRVIALAGVFQAVVLVRAVALRGGCDAAAMQSSLASVFKIDADNSADVFGGVSGVRLGLESLIAQLDEPKRDLTMARMTIGVLRLERKLAHRSDMRKKLRDGIEAIARQMVHMNSSHTDATAKLAQLYVDTLSHLRPRIIVDGSPAFLTQNSQVERIRALLMAGIRAAVLWRQLGGGQWRLLYRRREYAMLARGMLARCTLSGG